MRDVPLLRAAQTGDASELAKLLHDGCQADERDRTGNTALHAATFYGHILNMELLLRKGGADPDLRNDLGITALHYACVQGSEVATASARLFGQAASSDGIVSNRRRPEA